MGDFENSKYFIKFDIWLFLVTTMYKNVTFLNIYQYGHMK
jgi:hypothetical protein